MSKTPCCFVLGAAALVVGLAAAPVAADVDFGVRAGAYLEDSDPMVGVELLMPMPARDWFFNPNIEMIFADPQDRQSLNFDFHYDFRQTAEYYLWAGAGGAAIHTDSWRNRDDEWNAGLNLLGGIGLRLQGMTPYAQLKVVLSDESEVAAAVGIRF
ncbi:MAG: hypothetical protein F9K16_05795 [Thermoanaerobaculia bacterium]|jgi:opacity protein-like surface antigen|nr:MAG: hypothetical protein F9K16_05795 [Thermoanaerobaculia bacterium]MBZ0101842.1 hypothetical protein [Thermoanaerobaculia bacterium]